LSATIGRDARPASSAHARSRGLLACLALLGVLSASAIPATPIAAADFERWLFPNTVVALPTSDGVLKSR